MTRVSPPPRAPRTTSPRAARVPDLVVPDFALDTRQFGVEIEFVGGRRAVTNQLRRNGLNAELESYNHAVQRYWKVTTDASVPRGGELVSPPLAGVEGRRQVAVAARALEAAGASVDAYCGLHVHHEVRDMNVLAILRAVTGYHASQRAIDGLVASSRRSGTLNSYCGPLDLHELERLRACATLRDFSVQARYCNRFRAINVHAFPTYGTIEIRQHHGTINAEKILAWIAFGQSLFAAAAAGVDVRARDTQDLIAILSEHGNLDSGAAEYLRQRARDFATAVRR